MTDSSPPSPAQRPDGQTVDEIRQRVKGRLQLPLHELDLRIAGLKADSCHCGLVAEVALDALAPTFAALLADLDAAREALRRAESDVEELRGQRDFAMRELKAKTEAYDALSTEANTRLVRAVTAEATVQRVRELAERYKAEWLDNNGGQFFEFCYDDLSAALDSTDPVEVAPEKPCTCDWPATIPGIPHRPWCGEESDGGAPELNRLASSGSARRPTSQMLTQVPRVGPHLESSLPPAGTHPDAPERYYLMHDHGPGTVRHAHAVGQTHMGDVTNPRANDHTGVPTGTWEEMQAAAHPDAPAPGRSGEEKRRCWGCRHGDHQRCEHYTDVCECQCRSDAGLPVDGEMT